jgi:hypothetical protein
MIHYKKEIRRMQNNNIDSKDLQKGLDLISAKFGIDEQYTKKFFSEYEFAKIEAARVGLHMSRQLYKQLGDSFNRLSNIRRKPETFEKIWDSPAHKNVRGSSYRKVLAISAVITSIMGCAVIYLALRRLSK